MPTVGFLERFLLCFVPKDCNKCDKFLWATSSVYCCGPCRYFVHVKCATSEAGSSRGAEISSSNKDDELLESNPVNLPVNDEFVDMARYFVNDININEFEKETEINNWSHEHPLLLFDVQNINEEVQHPSHPEHLLELGRSSNIYSGNLCHCCNMDSNGLFYWCQTCEFPVDIKCAFLPSTIKHESHKHPLVQTEGSHHVCKSCDYKSSSFIFRCDTCNFNLDYNCALLPKTVKHRWDRHPLS
ncbi:unnamed protein product [Ilex paraguariensis]|uniref:DC1 domain-containing protein n=1 Tax=Ilex paraguariensis TaxID=185542 RepID=A0ABC8RK42_9AQUA